MPNTNNQKKYASLSTLQTFLDNLKTKFSNIGHKHTLSDITDYKVDSELSSSSTAPVQNKVLNAEFDEIAISMRALETTLDGKSDSTHDHNSLYYTESEIDQKLSAVNTSITNITNGDIVVKEAEHAANADEAEHANEANHASTADSATTANSAESATKATQDASGNVITSTYETKTDATAKLNEAKSYTDTKVANLASTSTVDTKISTHNTATTAHNDIRDLISGLTTRLNTLANSDDTTLDQMSEVVAYIKNNKSLIDGITTSKVNVTDIVNNLTTNVTSKPLSAAQGVAIKSLIDALQEELDSHTHAISDVTGLQSALDSKAASSHGTHVTYSTTVPVMDGTASVGSASTVARSDHKHPTDTSRASKTEFDTHTSNTTVHITSAERANWNAAKTHADSAHAPSNAEKNQNAFSNIKVGSTTIAADTVTDTLELVGSNVTIIPDTTNDKVTFSILDASTGNKGVVQLTNSTSSTSTTTAATPNSVKSAYDLANTAKTNAATAQSKADSAYTLAESKVDSLSDLGITATASELNYMDGVTSNVQSQLDSKADTSTLIGRAGEGNGAEIFNDYDSNTASGRQAHAEGYDTTASGMRSHAEGQSSTASAQATHAEGYNTQATATAAHSEGYYTEATGKYSHAEGYMSKTQEQYAHAEGCSNTASGEASHAEGYSTWADGNNSHTEGRYTTASGEDSHAEGFYTHAASDKQHVQGKYNIIDEDASGNPLNTYAHIVGNGTSNTKRSNAHTIDWDGNAWFAGDIFVGGTSQSDTIASKLISESDTNWTQIYDSGEITEKVNAFANINISGYKKFRVVVKCVNDGTNATSKNGAVTFTAINGTTYQFPCWTTMFTNAAYTSGNMATFEINDGWLICSDATRILRTSNFLGTEGGTADNLPSTGSGIMKCTNELSKMMVSSLDQDSNYYFLAGSRVMVWGCRY